MKKNLKKRNRQFDNIETLAEPERVYSSFVKGYTKLPVVLHGI